jgi:hypothetical protein
VSRDLKKHSSSIFETMAIRKSKFPKRMGETVKENQTTTERQKSVELYNSEKTQSSMSRNTLKPVKTQEQTESELIETSNNLDDELNFIES